MPHWEFPATEPVEVYAKLASGSISITAGPTELITVDVRASRAGRHAEEYAEAVRVDFADGQLHVVEPDGHWIRAAGLDYIIAVPAGSRCSAEGASAEISCTGEIGALQVKTASGSVQAPTITGAADVEVVSGRITIGSAGTVKARTASGSIELGQISGAVDVHSVSGRIRVASAGGSVSAGNSSGRISVDSISRGQAKIETVSGEVKVGVVQGTGVHLDLSSLSGRVTSDLDPADGKDLASPDQVDLRLKCRTVSGSIKVRRAELADVAS
jgi:hypothetical protein